MKLQINFNEELAKRIDEYADANYLSRSGFVSMACNQYLSAHEMSGYIKLLTLAMRKIADSGVVDPKTIEDLQDFERFVKMITGVKE